MADTYSTLLSVGSALGSEMPDAFPVVRELVCSWASHEGIAPPSAGREVSDSGDEYEVSSDRCREGEFWRLRWTRPDAYGRAVAWVSDVRLARSLESPFTEVSIQVRVIEQGTAPREWIAIGTPRLVSTLASDRRLFVHVDGRQLTGPQYVDTEGMQQFFDQVLVAERALPVLAVSPRTTDNQPYVTLYEMNRFLGLAEVWFLKTTSATRLLSDSLGQEMACYNGALRVWWPGISPTDDDPRDHPLWNPLQLSASPSRVLDSVYNLLTRVSERRVADGGPLWRAVTAATTGARENRLREALADAELVELATGVENELRIANADLKDIRAQNETLRKQVEQLIRDKEILEQRLSDAYRITSQLPKEQQPASQPDISDVASAVAEADGRFTHLRFTPESRRSADRSRFQRAPEVYRAFEVLDSLGAEMAANNGDIGGSLYDRLKLEGLDYRPDESDQTMSQWAAERRASLDGRTYEMVRHLAWGGPSRRSQEHIRVYFEWEPQGQFWVIGHVGNHPTNTLT